MSHGGTIPLFWPHELVIDLFAGGAGASTGIARAIGRSVDIAVNHDPEAMMVHRANHPTTLHYGGDVFDIEPRKVTRGQRVAILWASPSCTTHSRARSKEGPLDPQSRSGGDVVVKWAQTVKPRFILCENVIDWLKWSPIYPLDHPNPKLRGRPIPEREGEDFNKMIAGIERAGYRVEMRKLKAHHYGAPTTRERLFVIARADGRAIEWPEPTHGPGLLPYRTAREHIDLSLPSRSIFDPTRRKPVVEATLRRVARGLKKFGGEHLSMYFGTSTGTSLDTPLSTITAKGNHHALVQVGYGEHEKQKPRVLDLDKPLGTIVASGIKHAVVTAFVAKNYGGNYEGAGLSLDEPLSTITCIDHHSLVVGRRPGEWKAQCRAFLDTYVGEGALPEVEDIGMRMLTPRELFLCQGFPPSYEINPTVRGKGLSTTAQVRLVGNSVPPIMAEVLVRANIATAEALRVA